MPTWGQLQAFHGGTYIQRYPDLYRDLVTLNLGIGPTVSLMETVALLTREVTAQRERVVQLELESDLV